MVDWKLGTGGMTNNDKRTELQQGTVLYNLASRVQFRLGLWIERNESNPIHRLVL